MDLLADLNYYPATDAMQWAAAARFDGSLVFQRNHHKLTMSLAGGRIVCCDSNQPLESFRQHLDSQGWVDRLDLCAVDQYKGPGGLAEKLVELQVLTKQQAREIYSEYTLDLACSVVAWPDGVVAASATKLRPVNQLEATPIDPVFATLEGARRVDELARVSKLVQHDNVQLGAGDSKSNQADLSAAQERMLASFDGSQTVGELYQLVGGCKYNFLGTLEELVAAGVLICLEAGPSPPEEENRTSLADVLVGSDLDRRLMA